jgi:putative oxidoreductase
MVVAPHRKESPMSQSATAPASLGAVHPSAAGTSAAIPFVGRTLIATIFLLSGASKIAAPAMTIGYIQSVGLPLPMLGFLIALAVEIGGSLALILGYRTRLVAAIMALFTIATALAFHNDLADQNQFIHFFKNVAMAGGLLQIVAFGAGRFSLDARR